MKKVLTAAALLALAATASATTCLLTGDEDGGLTRICYYDCAGDRVAITVKDTDICPVTINR